MRGDLARAVATVERTVRLNPERYGSNTAAATTSRNIPASAPANRQERRALVKALGHRQFKKLYRKAQA